MPCFGTAIENCLPSRRGSLSFGLVPYGSPMLMYDAVLKTPRWARSEFTLLFILPPRSGAGWLLRLRNWSVRTGEETTANTAPMYELRAGRGITRVKFMYSTAVACEGETNLNWNLLLFYLIKRHLSRGRCGVCLLYVDALSCDLSLLLYVLERESLKRVRVRDSSAL